MQKIAIVLGTLIVVGFLLGMYVASLQSYEMKSNEYGSYINKNAIKEYQQEQLSYVSVTFCDTIYKYSVNDDVVVKTYNTLNDNDNDNKLGFSEITSKGVMEGLVILGVVGGLPAATQNAYTLMKSDWRYSVAGVVGLGLGFSLGYYIKHKDVCNCDQSKFHAYLSDAKNLRFFAFSLNANQNGVRIIPQGIVVDRALLKGIVKP